MSMHSVIPHRGSMCFVDTVVEATDAGTVVLGTVRQDHLFLRHGRIPGYVGIEYMAQAIAVWAGARAQRRGEPPPLGYLLGTRRYTMHRGAFAVGTQLRCTAQVEMMDAQGMGVFACTLHDGDSCCAQATLMVYQPQDADVTLPLP